jgi:cytochrome c oxidase cbb3-type subunit 2
MNRGPWIFLGALLALGASFYGLILRPQIALGRMAETKTIGDENTYPLARPGLAAQGEQIYRAHGCVYCHSQQVRPMEADLDKYGLRRSVASDYLFASPAQLGRQRMGPDLTNIGRRNRTAEWQLQHLYAPRMVSPGSTMPPYPWFFQVRPLRGEPLPEAIKLTPPYAPPEGYEVVPTRDALALVAYLNSLRVDVGLFEAPLPPVPTNAPAAGTNGVPAATNSLPAAPAP